MAACFAIRSGEVYEGLFPPMEEDFALEMDDLETGKREGRRVCDSRDDGALWVVEWVGAGLVV